MAKKQQPDFGVVNTMETIRVYDSLPPEVLAIVNEMIVKNNDAGEHGRNIMQDTHNAGWILWNEVVSRSFNSWGDASALTISVQSIIQLASRLVGEISYISDEKTWRDAVGSCDMVQETAEELGRSQAYVNETKHNLMQGFKLLEIIQQGMEKRMEEVLLMERAYEQVTDMLGHVASSIPESKTDYVSVAESWESFSYSHDRSWDAQQVLDKRRNPQEWYTSSPEQIEAFIKQCELLQMKRREEYYDGVEHKKKQREQAMVEWAEQQINEAKAKEEMKRQRAEQRKAARLQGK